MEALGESLKLMVKTFRRERHRVLQSERTTVHGADSMLMVLQLAMADVNKKRGGEFKVSLSDVLMAWKHLLVEKLHLPPPSCARLENHALILEAYHSFLKRSNTVDLVDVLSTCEQLKVLDPEEAVSPIQLCGFLSGNWDLPEFPSTPSSKSRPCSSQVKMAVRRVFCSYLSLLINSKDDLALALTLNVPDRSLGHQAFTDIKHAARDSSTSLFLALTSFIRAIQLGGKGYAPAESNPLRKHVKGLSEYVQFMDNLEEILGETPDPSTCGARLVTAIRAALAKGRCSGDPVYAAAEEISEELKERISHLHQIQKLDGNGTGISPARPKAYAVNHATAYGGRDTVKVLLALLDEEALAAPCRNKADLLCEDQPVLSGSEGTCTLLLFRSPEVSAGCSPEPLRNRVQNRLNLLKPKAKERIVRSQFACTYKEEEELPLSRVLDFPSASQAPTCVHPAPKTKTTLDARFSSELKDGITGESPSCGQTPQELNEGQQGSASLKQRSGAAQNQVTAPRGGKKAGVSMQSKRKQLDRHDGSENEPPEKRRQLQASAKGPGRNITKKTKLLAGQGKLTSFFRV
ncbi:hypothetical protein OJAV_G00222380 [Oryzias javanicus]|uniref:PCNA-interacting partner n=1 Tax=Oryzias javanicus TaxID=123683 RepID=A0A3S2PAN7_ORYJA|nr:hypothetical protein OJAV_G00222380 [Oryzias javanicus]